jgi:deoxyribodipyrimidine photo-lyase
MTTIIWFRRDLRIRDNPALIAALDSGEDVIPFFCLDERLVSGRFASGPRTQFMLESLHDLDAALRARGSGLVIRTGDPLRELIEVAHEIGVERVHATVDAGPYGRRRDQTARERLEQAGITLRGHAGLFAVDNLEEMRTGSGGPFRVFTPFYRSWLTAPRRDVERLPRSLPALPAKLKKGRIPSLETLGLASTVTHPMAGGEEAGLKRWRSFRDGALSGYDSGRDDLAGDGSSKLSPYLHFGCISPRQLEAELPDGVGAEEFRRQLAWRDFYAHVLREFPDNRHHEYQPRYRDRIEWRDDAEDFERWCQGRTGYPLVDAGMRQLATEGWMHNRARLVVGSFLTKELGIDWRRGEQHFMSLLLDGDMCSNNGNWQWIASVGVDPQPVSRRILSPSRQQEKFDPTGAYVRRYVPELANVPNAHIVEPWLMPEEVQREVGCVIGEDYAEPIVDRRDARAAALERYGAASASAPATHR